MLALEFESVEIYRTQLAAAEITRHDTGCSIEVDRSRAPAAPYAERWPSDVLLEASGHGKLWLMLHVHEGYLDDLEMVFSKRLPDPWTIRPHLRLGSNRARTRASVQQLRLTVWPSGDRP